MYTLNLALRGHGCRAGLGCVREERCGLDEVRGVGVRRLCLSPLRTKVPSLHLASGTVPELHLEHYAGQSHMESSGVEYPGRPCVFFVARRYDDMLAALGCPSTGPDARLVVKPVLGLEAPHFFPERERGGERDRGSFILGQRGLLHASRARLL